MATERTIQATLISPNRERQEVDFQLGNGGVYSDFILKIKESLEHELKFGITIPEDLKRNSEGKLRRRKELHQVLSDMTKDNRRFIAAFDDPDSQTRLLIHTDAEGLPLAVSLPQQRRFEPKGKGKTKS